MEIITRGQLYTLVWSEPIAKLAPRYGLSDRGMGKLCARHNVPVPPRGYWAQKAVGKRVTQPPLPAGANVQIRLGDPKPQSPTPDAPEPVPSEIAFERDPVNFVVVEPNAHLTHPLVRAAADRLRGEAADRDGIVRSIHCLEVRVSLASLSRALRIMQALIVALEARGHSVAVKERVTQATVLGEPIDILLREQLRRKIRDLTSDEQRRRRDGMHVDPYELEPTGELSLGIDRGYSRRGASDGKNHRLEDLINRFIEILIKEALRNKEMRAEREREESRRREAERRRKEREKLQRQEEAQIERLDKLVECWTKTQKRRAFLAELRMVLANVEAQSPLAHWLKWAEDFVESCDPLDRFKNRDQTLKLYFGGYNHQIAKIRREGFEDPEPSEYDRQKTPAGVVLRDRRPAVDWLNELLEVELPEDLVLPYETTEPGYVPRTFCIPARVLNERGANAH